MSDHLLYHILRRNNIHVGRFTPRASSSTHRPSHYINAQWVCTVYLYDIYLFQKIYLYIIQVKLYTTVINIWCLCISQYMMILIFMFYIKHWDLYQEIVVLILLAYIWKLSSPNDWH